MVVKNLQNSTINHVNGYINGDLDKVNGHLEIMNGDVGLMNGEGKVVNGSTMNGEHLPSSKTYSDFEVILLFFRV